MSLLSGLPQPCNGLLACFVFFQVLLSYGASTDIADGDGLTPLDICQQHDEDGTEILRLLQQGKGLVSQPIVYLIPPRHTGCYTCRRSWSSEKTKVQIKILYIIVKNDFFFY